MVNTIVLSLSLLLAFITGFFVALKSVSLGLKWQMQTKEGKEPELKTPIVSTVQERAQEKKIETQQQYSKEMINEWLYGEGGDN